MRVFRDHVLNNIGLKLIALLVAVLIWIFVTNDNDPTGSLTITNVPITIVNEDSIADIGKVVEPQGSGTVTVKVTERRSIRNRISRNGSNFYVEADLENINQMNTVPLTVTCDNPSVTWDEIAISPASLKVTLEDKVEQAFAVNVMTSGEPGEGRAVGTTEILEGKNILIAGPESLVSIIGQVNAPVSVAGMTDDMKVSALLRIYDKNGAEFTESQLGRLELKSSDGNLLEDRSVNVQIRLWQTRLQVPIEIVTEGMVAEGYEITTVDILPAQVALAATEEAFAAMGEALVVGDAVQVEGATEDFTQEIDLTQSVSAYGSMRLIGDTDPVVSVTIHVSRLNIQQVDVPLSAVTLKEKPENMKLIFTPADKLTLNVYPPESAEPLTVDDVKVEIDLTVCRREGNYEIPAEVTLPEGYSLSDDVKVKVSVTREKSDP